MDWYFFQIFFRHRGYRSRYSCFFAYRSITTARDQVSILSEKLEVDRKFRKMEIHSRLLAEGRAIQAKFPPDVNNPEWVPSEEEKREILMFWYHIFDEWVICKHENNELNELWDRYYRKGVKSALKKVQFRESLKELLGSSELFETVSEFSNEMDTICIEATEIPLGAKTSN